MCLLIAKKEDIKIDKKYLKNGWRENPHGAGFVVAKHGKLLMRKGFTSFKTFWKAWREYEQYPAVVHFRWANIGKINYDNCHPFIVDNELAFAHNGTIPIATDGEKSDTRTFCEEIARKCKEYNPNFLDDPITNWFISKSIGNSKLAFIDNHGKLTIINQDRGEFHEETWYSNTDYKQFESKKNWLNNGSNVSNIRQSQLEQYERMYGYH